MAEFIFPYKKEFDQNTNFYLFMILNTIETLENIGMTHVSNMSISTHTALNIITTNKNKTAAHECDFDSFDDARS